MLIRFFFHFFLQKVTAGTKESYLSGTEEMSDHIVETVARCHARTWKTINRRQSNCTGLGFQSRRDRCYCSALSDGVVVWGGDGKAMLFVCFMSVVVANSDNEAGLSALWMIT